MRDYILADEVRNSLIRTLAGVDVRDVESWRLLESVVTQLKMLPVADVERLRQMLYVRGSLISLEGGQ